jgi:hypothetical protein
MFSIDEPVKSSKMRWFRKKFAGKARESGPAPKGVGLSILLRCEEVVRSAAYIEVRRNDEGRSIRTFYGTINFNKNSINSTSK